eukprot:s250_g8.t1
MAKTFFGSDQRLQDAKLMTESEIHAEATRWCMLPAGDSFGLPCMFTVGSLSDLKFPDLAQSDSAARQRHGHSSADSLKVAADFKSAPESVDASNVLEGLIVDVLKQLPDHKFGKQQVLLGRLVCQDAFRRLLGIGASRYARLKRAAVTGAPVPLDGRRLKKPLLAKNKASVVKRSIITSYLTELYHTLSEPMPEASQSLKQSSGDAGAESVPRKMRFRRNRGRRPRAAGLWIEAKIKPSCDCYHLEASTTTWFFLGPGILKRNCR